MNQIPKALWLARLRDPNAKQARGRLREGDSMCCLGHACDVSGVGEWKDDSYSGIADVLPCAVSDWLGMDSLRGVFRYLEHGLSSHLADLNDNGLTLSQIADVIEYFADEL